MTDQPEEVSRLVQAIEALEAMDDDAECAVAVSQILDKWPTHHSRLRELRQRRVQALRTQGKTWREIGELLGGISPARAQQIATGLRGTKRPTKATEGE